MDIYEFSQALRRQWKLLVIGSLSLVVGVLVAVFEVKSVNGETTFESRITPKYESTIEMVVVPAGLESLSSRDVAGGSGAAAEVYSQMLETPEAARQIEETQDITLIETLSANSADSFMTVTAISDTAEGAAAGALGAFRWLEGRLADPPILAQLPEPETIEVPEEFLGTVLVEVDRLYSTADPELTLVMGDPQGNEFAVSLEGASGQIESQVTRIRPGSPLEMTVERQVGVPLDSATLQIPELAEWEGGEIPPLILGVEWGAVAFEPVPVDQEGQLLPIDPENPPGAEIDPSRLSIRWDSTALAPIEEIAEINQVSLLLITEEVIAEETGQRRTPVMVGALLIVGVLLLLVAAVTIDTWQNAKLERRRMMQADEAVSLDAKREGLHLAHTEPAARDETGDRGRGRRSGPSSPSS